MGEFRIDAVLGQGGSGIVYDATWGPRRVALKVLHAELVGTGKERAQFLAEAQRLQQIGHPSVVKVLAVGKLPDGRPYLAMERLEGETLAAAIARGPLALASRTRAVRRAVRRGRARCTTRASSIAISSRRTCSSSAAGGHAVLLDFGIAKDLAAPASTTTQEGHVRGTPAYMAPERFFGQPAGLATDVYELALVLYAMLAGRLPWHRRRRSRSAAVAAAADASSRPCPRRSMSRSVARCRRARRIGRRRARGAARRGARGGDRRGRRAHRGRDRAHAPGRRGRAA